MCDRQSAIHLSKNQQFHEGTKHIDVKLQFIREILKKGTVKKTKEQAEDNAADMLTKVVTRAKLEHCLATVAQRLYRPLKLTRNNHR